MVHLNISVLATAFLGIIPVAAADNNGSATLSADASNAIVFVSSDAVALIIILLVLLIILLILAIIYMISTLIPKLASGKKAKIQLHISETTQQQIDLLMKKEKAANRDEFVLRLIIDELTSTKSTHVEQQSIQEVISAYVGSHETQERFRRFVAESLLGEDDGDQTIIQEDVR